ncbi:MAG: hypothetical protein GX308_00475 [Epulopiscium sp.]|nr:hypothetical protein [Candidatus Epulonipiscium sp.]
MKKRKTILFWIGILVVSMALVWFIRYTRQWIEISKNINMMGRKSNIQESVKFDVYYKNSILKSFNTEEDAIKYAREYKYTYVKKTDKDEWIWNNFDAFILYEEDRFINDYTNFSEAIFFAKERENSRIYYKSNKNIIWSNSKSIKESIILDAPVILQKPELPRGCEVTSLAMLLNYAGIKSGKMELAEKIAKDTTAFEIKDGRVYFGNPNDGFVGDMYSLNNPGYGVYDGPIEKLMEEYMPGKTINLTGCEFEDLFHFISNEIPVWVIANTTYRKLDEDKFDVWITPTGPVEITYKLHAFLLTGYDKEYIYFNDPFYSKKNIKVNIKDFKEAWNQMGRQAISYIN